MITVHLDSPAGRLGSCQLRFESSDQGYTSWKFIYLFIREQQLTQPLWIKYIGEGDNTCSFEIIPTAMNEKEKELLKEPWIIKETESGCTNGWFASCKKEHTIFVNDDGWLSEFKNYWNGVRIKREQLTYRVESL